MRSLLLALPKVLACAGALAIAAGATWLAVTYADQSPPEMQIAELADPAPVKAAEAKPLQPPEALLQALPDTMEAANGMDFLEMQLFYVKSDSAPAETEYLTLDEAMKSGVAGVRDTGPWLTAYNLSDQPVFGMAGDLLLGGSQDRILAQGIVLEPHSQDVRVKAFCVEHGRSGPQAKDAGRAYAKHFYKEDDRAQVDLRVRRAAVRDDKQAMVWEAVKLSNKALGIDGDNRTDTVRHEFSSRNVQVRAQVMVNEALDRLQDGTVGFALVTDGRVAAMDVFESSGLCRKLSPKLLKGYAMTALLGELALPDTVDETDAPSTPPTPEDVPVTTKNSDAATVRRERIGKAVKSTVSHGSEQPVHLCMIGY